MSERFEWHPEPELIGYDDEAEARHALEALGRSGWDTALDYLYEHGVRRPIGDFGYPELRRRFFGDSLRPGPPPSAPRTSEDVLSEVRERLAPNLYNAVHAGSFSYFTPPPLAMSVVGETLAQWMNQGVDLWTCARAAAFVEEEVVAWLAALAGYGEGSFGVLTSGGTHANLMALTIARDVHLARTLGLVDPPRAGALEGVRVYASDQAHYSIERALDLLGFPKDTLCTIPADERFRLHGEAVAAAIAQDRAAGLTPFAIAAVSGSTNTGSVDLVGELADVAEREGLWLHVDAAYGGAVRLSAREAARVPHLQRADSVTVDPHKWFFQAYDVGALLVRRREDLLHTFHRSPEYYRDADPEREPLQWYRYAIESTRRFRALKLWLSWKHLGTEGLGRLVERTLDLAAHLARRCSEAGDLEAMPEHPELSVVCFRHLPGERAADLDPEALDRYQDRLQRALEASGEGWLSTTRLRGRTYLRAGIVNYLSSPERIDTVLAALRRLSAGAAAEARLA